MPLGWLALFMLFLQMRLLFILHLNRFVLDHEARPELLLVLHDVGGAVHGIERIVN
jgi:hypothetical protein